MASINDLYRRRQGASLTTCAPPQPSCSTCGMLECTCRPRFFAGQVLNADDLNRLDAYIRAKQRLHNRQLHGWGVVNGLEVMCNPCGDGIAVGCGYALSQCGDDIVVCEAVSVPVCDLIRRCRDAQAKGPCPPFQSPNAGGCDAADEEWVLAIRYSEKPQRGVQPLYAPTQVDCGCSCGGSKGGCGCGGSTSRATGTKTSSGSCGCKGQCSCGSNAAKPRGAPVQCEPTVICEGFEFEVYRREQAQDNPEAREFLSPDSQLLQRFKCCVDDLFTKAPQSPGPFSPAAVAANPNAWYLWACRFQAHLLRHVQQTPGYNCALLPRLAALVIVQPTPNGQGVPELLQAIELMMLEAIDGLLACLCSALLPPCPLPVDEGRVPLAVLHVAGNPCRVVRVCNWAVERKFATTFPALQYWLSLLPFGANLRQLLQTLCCFDVTSIFPQDRALEQPAPVGVVQPNIAAPHVAMGAAAPAADMFHQQGILRLNPTIENAKPLSNTTSLLASTLFSTTALEPEKLINTLLTKAPADAKLSGVESSNLPQFLLLNQIAKPIAQAFASPLAGAVLAHRLGAMTAAPPPPQAPRDDATVAAMRSEIASLRAAVEQQAAQIAELQPGGGGRPRKKRGNR
jgi:hypothetical protein